MLWIAKLSKSTSLISVFDNERYNLIPTVFFSWMLANKAGIMFSKNSSIFGDFKKVSFETIAFNALRDETFFLFWISGLLSLSWTYLQRIFIIFKYGVTKAESTSRITWLWWAEKETIYNNHIGKKKNE